MLIHLQEILETPMAYGIFPLGIIETSMSGQVMSRTKDQIKEITCLGRFGKTKEISKMATFLASDNSSSYITGECITIDGGII